MDATSAERDRRKLAVRVEIAAYAAKVAGTRADLDPELERAASSFLVTEGLHGLKAE